MARGEAVRRTCLLYTSIPVKYALNRIGFAAGQCRLPLIAPAAEVRRRVDEALEGLGLLAAPLS